MNSKVAYYTSFYANRELEKSLVNDKITASCHTLLTTKVNFEKLLDQQVFKNHNCNPFKSSSSFSIRPYFCIYCLIHSFLQLSEQ